MTDIVVPLRVTCRGRGIDRAAEPLSAGIPFPRGAFPDGLAWTLQAHDGTRLPLQLHVLERWPDGSVRWALLDTRVSTPAGATGITLTLRGAPSAAEDSGAKVTIAALAAGQLKVNTGVAGFTLSPDSSGVLSHVSSGDRTIPDGTTTELTVRGENERRWPISWQPLSIESEGPVRVRIVARGAAGDGRARLQLALSLDFYAGLPVVRTRLTVTNRRRARHPGGVWELGDPGSVLLRELSLVLRPAHAAASRIRWSLEPESWDVAAGKFHVHQDSSGGDNWSSTNHIARQGRVSTTRRGYDGASDDRPLAGLRATPIAVIEGADTVGAAVPHFWQNFPRALTATGDALTVSFFPDDGSAPHELQGGEQKTHECYLLFGHDPVTEQPLEWCRSPLLLHADPGWYVSSDAVTHLVTAADDDPEYRALVDAAIEGGDTFVAKRERADEYGWRHFGDIYGDHEAVFQKAPALMSHYNNQYDPVAGFIFQFIRTADPRWWTACAELAAHVVDIDLYHTDDDKAAYNHGLFWHTYHYVDAGRATHRSYPTGTAGGGPSAEHNYTTGLMLHYLMTGDRASRAAALALAQFVVDMDDGARTVFRWLDNGYTGVASASRSPDYQGPGRGSGNSISALVDGHRLSGDRTFLNKAEQIIRRCTHPRQDLAELELLNPENRWFYTMHLQSLGKYLERKIELNEIDAMYAYARDVLLHFARWMAVHERPYLSHPELLEYPTETWAAQDIRKSEVFDFAASHAADAERSQFLERAEYFFDYSITALRAMPTRTLARPVVLLLAHGFRRAHVRRHGVRPAPAPDAHWSVQWPHPEVFVPQKARAKRRALALAAFAVPVGLAGVLALLWLVFR